MTHEISFEMYKWLSSLQIIASNQKYKSSGNIQIDSKIHDQLVSGHSLSKLVQKAAVDSGVELNGPLLSSMKKSNTPAARVYNWNILADSFSKLGISLSKQTQKEITTGSFEELKLFLIEVHKKLAPAKKKEKSELLESESSLSTKVDFKRMDGYQTFEETETVTEAVLRAIKVSCGLSLKQAHSTLSEGGKYLAHMVVKGIRGSYEEIEQLLKMIVDNMSHIMFLCEKDPAASTQFLLEVVKPSLISRDSGVAQLGCRALQALLYESLKYNSKNLVYQLLSREESGFDFIYMGIKRHPQLSLEYNGFLHPLVETVYKEFYHVYLKSVINDEQEYLRTTILLLEGLLTNDQSRRAAKESGLLQYWLDTCEDSFASSKSNKRDYTPVSEETKALSLELLLDLWKGFSEELGELEAEELILRGIDELKKNTRKEHLGTKVSALNRLFDFFDHLATRKSKLASVLYKKMIFLFVENHEEEEVRQVILQNFGLILKGFPTIPLEFLLEPLLRQLTSSEGKSYILNVYDFEFLVEVFRHPKMEAAYALNFLEYFSRLYVKNVIYSGLVIRLIELLSARYCEEEAIMEYITKNVASNLNTYGVLVLGRTQKRPLKQTPEQKDEAILSNQKKSLIVELLKHYVRLENRAINEAIKARVASLYVEWADERQMHDKGLHSILTLFGDVEEIAIQERVDRESSRNRYQNGFTPSSNHTNSLISGSEAQSRQQIGSMAQSKIIPKNIEPVTSQLYKGELPSSDSRHKGKEDDFFYADMYSNSVAQKGHPRQAPVEGNQNIIYYQQEPDPRTLEDIQNSKMRYRKESERKKQLLEKESETEQPKRINQTELIQRQISLGYAKLPNFKEITSENMLFDFDSVKKRHLKEETELIDLETEEPRDKQSAEKVLARYDKYLKSLFYKYTAQGNAANRIGSSNSRRVLLSFTDLMRMLKDKNLNRLPKIIVNELIIHINRKNKFNANISAGIPEEEFNEFLVVFTNLYAKAEQLSVDEPFGSKVEKVILRLLSGETFAKDITDPKCQQWLEENQILEMTDEEQSYVNAPEGFKKVMHNEVVPLYKVSSEIYDVPESYSVCIEVANSIFSNVFGINIFPPITEVKKVSRIVSHMKIPKAKVTKHMTHAAIKSADISEGGLGSNQFTYPTQQLVKKRNSSLKSPAPKVKRVTSHKDLKKSNQADYEDLQKKHELQKKHAVKLKQELQVLRVQRQKKQETEKLKKQQEEKAKAKKQEAHKKYLEENKWKIEEKKKEDEKQSALKKQKQQELKEKQTALIREKQKELLEKEREKIKQKKQRFEEKNREISKKKEKLENFSKKAIEDVVESMKSENTQELQKEKKLNESLENEDSSLLKAINNYEEEVKLLFEDYWNWKTKKIELKSVAVLMKNFRVSPEYLTPKAISEVYKSMAKGEALGLESFKKLLVKFSFRSEKLKQEFEGKSELDFDPRVPQYLASELLGMKEHHYQEVLKKVKY